MTSVAHRLRAGALAPDPDTPLPRTATESKSRPPVLSRATAALLAARDRAQAQASKLRAERATAAAVADVRSPQQRRMDSFLAEANAAYRVDGQEVRVTPAFRMNGGYGPTTDEAMASLERALPPKLLRELRPRLPEIVSGKGTPEEIRRVTQALIDGGRLPPSSTGSARDRVRQLMFDFGIGLDCSGFSYQAHLAAEGKPRKLGLNERIPAPFKSMDLRRAQPGDLIVLGGEVGHKVAVYSHRELPAGSPPPSFGGRAPVPATFVEGGPVHVFEVDSSWGARGRAPRGGVSREIWLFNEHTKTWGYFDGHQGGAFTESKEGAYDHPIVGLYGTR